MIKQSKHTNKEKSFSKNPPDISGESYVFVKYSDLMDFIRSVKDASIALFHLATVSAGIKLMSMRPEEIEKLSQRLMDISDIKPNRLSVPKKYEAGGSEKFMEMISKSFDSHLVDSPTGRIRKSRKR